MLITALTISDYKRVRKVAITPSADRSIILIGGKNGAGKSSTLDALTAAFGGAKQVASDPVRHGAGEASIFVELDGGKLTIDRVITADGKTTLEVRDAEGAVRQPQKVLDALVGARFLDPLAFLGLAAKEQRAQLMKLIKDADRIVDLDGKKARAFDRRTEVGRDLTKAEGELARLPEATAGTPIDVAKLTAESRELAEKQRAGDGLGAVLREAEASAARANDQHGNHVQQIEEMKQKLERLIEMTHSFEAESTKRRAVVDEAKAKLESSAAEWAKLAPRRDQVDAELAKADGHNREVYAAEAQAKRRVETAAAIAKLRSDYDDLTKGLKAIEARKAEVLAAAKLPVDGLALADDGILLNGVPFAQASDAERLRVALALAIAGSPQLGDVWIHDGALLDDDSLELVAKHAAAAGKRVWLERVGTKDVGVIEIRDGEVAP
jgi:DNA repair exonuclease SbcCD ATPase subunit